MFCWVISVTNVVLIGVDKKFCTLSTWMAYFKTLKNSKNLILKCMLVYSYARSFLNITLKYQYRIRRNKSHLLQGQQVFLSSNLRSFYFIVFYYYYYYYYFWWDSEEEKSDTQLFNKQETEYQQSKEKMLELS